MAKNGVSLYPPPQKVLKDCLASPVYKFTAKTVTVEFVRAAVIMPRDLPFSHLLAVPWSMVWTTAEWRMIIVSVQDNRDWIQLARMTGAVAWNVGSLSTCVYEYHEPIMDEHGLEIRGSGARAPGNKEGVDADGIRDDLLYSFLSQVELATKWDVSVGTIQNIAKRNNIRKKRPRNVKTFSHNNLVTL